MHDHAAERREQGGRRLLFAFLVVCTVMFVEVVGAMMSGSLALLSDAGHMLIDALALGIGAIAIRMGRRQPTESKTYGWRRLEILAAFLNGILLIVVVGFIIVEAVERFASPPSVRTDVMMKVGGFGLLANIGAILLLHGHRHTTQNIRAAFLHVLADTLSSVGVITAAVIIAVTGWKFMDPVVSIGIALVILSQVKSVLFDSANILLEGAPPHLSLPAIENDILIVPGVAAVHDLHLTTYAGDEYILTAHIVVGDRCDWLSVLHHVRSVLSQQHGILHATLEPETEAKGAGHNHCSATLAPPGG